LRKAVVIGQGVVAATGGAGGGSAIIAGREGVAGGAGDEEEGIGRSFEGVLKCEFAWLICGGLELTDSLSAVDSS
jgi:hypothetical protein